MSFAQERERMVREQIAHRGIHDPLVLAAMRGVPREEFVAGRLHESAYDDSPLPIEEGQTISQPYIVALMVEASGMKPTDRVLEVGCGSGYAAAVMSRIASEVFAIEWHASLAESARERMARLGYDNVHVMRGDGSLGWREHAPYDAIIVSAGGPEVPQSLLEQLKIGGCMVIPIGDQRGSQELLRIERTGEHAFDRESLGRVQFVPLVGSEGWSVDGLPLPKRRADRPLRVDRRDRERVADVIREACEPLVDIERSSIDPLLDRIGSARVVLIGEATHGTTEFYAMRARITRELIVRRGFDIVAIEGDWPDVSVLDRRVRGRSDLELPSPAFSRFPTWMWRNDDMRRFVGWLTSHNARIGATERRVRLCGLDLYSLYNSIGAVLGYLDRVDPEAAALARERYGCFSPWEEDPATYGRAAVSGRMRTCEQATMEMLSDLLARRMEYVRHDGESFFDVARNATVIREAERYYRAMYYGSRESWNLRDKHMFETLEAVMAQGGPRSRAVVWAHNSHVGDASATEMGMRGEWNIGQLARERFGSLAYSIGFGTDHGTVAAATNWDDELEVKRVRPAHEDSYERLCHLSGVPAFLLHLRSPRHASLRRELMAPHLERAIGVIYRPETERVSHYFQATLPAQFDEWIWFDESHAVLPLPMPEGVGAASGYPFES